MNATEVLLVEGEGDGGSVTDFLTVRRISPTSIEVMIETVGRGQIFESAAIFLSAKDAARVAEALTKGDADAR